MFIHIHEHHDPCCTQCNFVARKDNEGMEKHMEIFKHTWHEISKVQCSAWGCQKKFKDFNEYWLHRFHLHGQALLDVKFLSFKKTKRQTKSKLSKKTFTKKAEKVAKIDGKNVDLKEQVPDDPQKKCRVYKKTSNKKLIKNSSFQKKKEEKGNHDVDTKIDKKMLI